MGFLSLVGNSFGCSASGERLVSAARDGDLKKARALLEYNPRLARYSTFGVRNSPLHYATAQGHHEIVSLLLESGVEINLRNYRGQTALMQACQYGHWEVVQTLILFNANVHKTDYLNGGTALHFAALHGQLLILIRFRHAASPLLDIPRTSSIVVFSNFSWYTYLSTINGQHTSIEVKHSSYLPLAAVRKDIADETNRETDHSKQISPIPIHLSIFSPHVQQL